MNGSQRRYCVGTLKNVGECKLHHQVKERKKKVGFGGKWIRTLTSHPSHVCHSLSTHQTHFLFLKLCNLSLNFLPKYSCYTPSFCLLPKRRSQKLYSKFTQISHYTYSKSSITFLASQLPSMLCIRLLLNVLK